MLKIKKSKKKKRNLFLENKREDARVKKMRFSAIYIKLGDKVNLSTFLQEGEPTSNPVFNNGYHDTSVNYFQLILPRLKIT